ncbi:barstar family protein [Streptomyces sp. NPDC012693]|uniref:barstar family protein n=1 Tax=Streptomyces sp. NPDC012693 TaxID=3364844 RepID=UPI0036A143A6
MVIIDVSGIRDHRRLHSVLRDALDFPPFYGMNRAAFWDAITGLVEMPDRLTFTGWSDLTKSLPDEADLLRQALDDFRRQYRADFVAEYRERVVVPR